MGLSIVPICIVTGVAARMDWHGSICQKRSFRSMISIESEMYMLRRMKSMCIVCVYTVDLPSMARALAWVVPKIPEGSISNVIGREVWE